MLKQHRPFCPVKTPVGRAALYKSNGFDISTPQTWSCSFREVKEQNNYKSFSPKVQACLDPFNLTVYTDTWYPQKDGSFNSILLLKK